MSVPHFSVSPFADQAPRGASAVVLDFESSSFGAAAGAESALGVGAFATLLSAPVVVLLSRADARRAWPTLTI